MNAVSAKKSNCKSQLIKYWSFVRGVHVQSHKTESKTLVKTMNSPSPNLQVLLYDDPLRPTNTFLGDACRSLQSLRIGSAHIESNPHFPVLRKLAINGRTSMYSWDVWWDFLRATPQLEELVLSTISVAVEDRYETLHHTLAHSARKPPIDLPFLKTFRSLNSLKFSLRLLQALPDPSQELSVEIRDLNPWARKQDTWCIGGSDGRHSGTSEYELLFDWMNAFQITRTGEPHIRGGMFLSQGEHMVHDLEFVYASANGSKLLFKTRYPIKASHPVLGYVDEVHLQGVMLSFWIQDTGAEHLTAIHSMSLHSSRPGPSSTFGDIRTWIHGRIDDGCPLKQVTLGSTVWNVSNSHVDVLSRM
jgi:hypothetical protein